MKFDPKVLEEVATRVVGLDRRRTALVGIDGRGGSGKSTLAMELAALLPNVTVVHFDDFYRAADERKLRAASGDDEVGGNFDWQRVRDQVLQPLAEWAVSCPGGIVIVEGNSSTRHELHGYYDITIWVDTPHDVRLRRGVERDGEQARATWLEEWIPEEDRYVASQQPADRADIVVSGTTA